VAHVVYSYGTGGLEKGIATLVNNSSPDIEHVIICLSTSGDTENLLLLNTPVLELNKQPGNSFLFVFSLAKCLATIRPDIIHTRNWSGMDGIIAARMAHINKIVHSEHGCGMQGTRKAHL